jgi:primase-polymerase (primpol)-like protein
MDQQGDHSFKPKLYCGDLAKLPAALKPLRARPQWVIWRLIWQGKRWTKAPFRCNAADRYASSNDPSTWSSYEAAVAAAGAADGISYVLTPEDSFAAADIDHVRDPVTGTIESWA